MRDKFIKLTEKNDTHYVSPMMICSINVVANGVYINTIDGKTIIVDESIDDVLKQIKNSDSYTIINK